MKKLRLLFLWLLPLSAAAQEGYEIKVTFQPFRNQYVYLGHYFGRQYPIVDSALLDDKGQAVFSGSKKLPGGIYLVGYPNKSGFFEILLDQHQRFSVIADTATLPSISFVNSPDNDLFRTYQQAMISRGEALAAKRKLLGNAKTASDSAKIHAEMEHLDRDIVNFREALIKDHPGTLLATLLVAMREPEMPPSLGNPRTRQDSIATFDYYKQHYWDGVNFFDGRLAYTTFFEEKLDKYFNQVVAPHPDSVIREIDWMMGFASINREMEKFLLLKFVNRFLNQKYMWEDAVFVHLFEKYFAQKDYDWLTEKGKKTITDRAYNLMANIMGSPAAVIELPDTSGKSVKLYDLPATYTLITFWDPKCGHCREVLPKVDSMYRSKWKSRGLKIYAVAKETDGTREDWLKFIREHKLQDWTHVYYSKVEERARISANIPGYSQLYDVLTFPTLYLLDKDKRIIAKKLSYEQMDEVLDAKGRGQ